MTNTASQTVPDLSAANDLIDGSDKAFPFRGNWKLEALISLRRDIEVHYPFVSQEFKEALSIRIAELERQRQL